LILEAAGQILRESGGASIESDEIARQALARGYRTSSARNPEGDPEKVIRSFHAIMKRNPNVFEKQGKRFRIKQDEPIKYQGD
jgi:hypothetical protein